MQGSQIGDRMQGAQLGSHTIQTHGARLARKHTHDWVVLILLAALVVALHYAPPFNRFVGKDMMTDIRYPVKPSTVPAWAVPVCFSTFCMQFCSLTQEQTPFNSDVGHWTCFQIISILCPWIIFVSIYVARRDVYDLHHATLGDLGCPCYLLVVKLFSVLSCGMWSDQYLSKFVCI